MQQLFLKKLLQIYVSILVLCSFWHWFVFEFSGHLNIWLMMAGQATCRRNMVCHQPQFCVCLCFMRHDFALGTGRSGVNEVFPCLSSLSLHSLVQTWQERAYSLDRLYFFILTRSNTSWLGQFGESKGQYAVLPPHPPTPHFLH